MILKDMHFLGWHITLSQQEDLFASLLVYRHVSHDHGMSRESTLDKYISDLLVFNSSNWGEFPGQRIGSCICKYQIQVFAESGVVVTFSMLLQPFYLIPGKYRSVTLSISDVFGRIAICKIEADLLISFVMKKVFCSKPDDGISALL